MRTAHALSASIAAAALAGAALAAAANVRTEGMVQASADFAADRPHSMEPWPAHGVERIHIEAASGPVRVVGVDGDEVRAYGAAPAVMADDGVLRIAHHGAALLVEAPRGIPVSVRSAAGAVDCEGLSGGVQVQSLQGAVRLTDIEGSVNADVSAGDIALIYGDAWTDDSAVSCRTVDGAIDIALPADAAFDLAVESLDDDFRNDFPVLIAGGDGDGVVRAKVGHGGAPVVVNTLDGPIALRKIAAP